MAAEHVLAWWPEQGLSCKSQSLPRSSTRAAGTWAEPRNVPLGKAQPVLAWRQIPTAGSELGCQLSSYLLQGVRCLGTVGHPLAGRGAGLQVLQPLGF